MATPRDICETETASALEQLALIEAGFWGRLFRRGFGCCALGRDGQLAIGKLDLKRAMPPRGGLGRNDRFARTHHRVAALERFGIAQGAMKPIQRAKLFAADRERLIGSAVKAGGKAIKTHARIRQATRLAAWIKAARQPVKFATDPPRLGIQRCGAKPGGRLPKPKAFPRQITLKRRGEPRRRTI